MRNSGERDQELDTMPTILGFSNLTPNSRPDLRQTDAVIQNRPDLVILSSHACVHVHACRCCHVHMHAGVCVFVASSRELLYFF